MSEARAARPQKPSQKPPAPLWRRLLAEAWRGATEPSAPLLAVCLIAFAATLALGAWMFTPQAMAGPAGDYIARSGQDGDAFATVNAIRLARRPQHAPTLVVLGTSTIAQGLGGEHVVARRRHRLAKHGAQRDRLALGEHAPLRGDLGVRGERRVTEQQLVDGIVAAERAGGRR